MMSFARFRIALLLTIAAGAALFAHGAHAQQYTRFGPATGILVGNVNTPQTTAAASSNVISLWTGTCNASTFLKADGSCAAALSGTVGVANGGTGAVTLSGVLKGNATSPVTSAASADVVSLWSGTCNSSTFLRGDGSCNSPGGAGTVTSVAVGASLSASPSPIISSGTISLNLANANTWSASQTFGAASRPLTIAATAPTLYYDQTGAAANERLWREVASGGTLFFDTRTDLDGAGTQWLQVDRTGSTVDGIQFSNSASGEIKLTGTNTGVTNLSFMSFRESGGTRTGYVGDGGSGSSDIILAADTAAASIQLLTGAGGTIQGNSVDMTPVTQTFSATVTTGCTTTPSVAGRIVRSGSIVTFWLDQISCTSNVNSLLLAAAIPAGYRPVHNVNCATVSTATAVLQLGAVNVAPSGDLNFALFPGGNSGWPTSGNKGVNFATCTYPLNN